MPEHMFTGFGFGPIQAGLFAKEAFESGNFSRIAVAEVDAELVEAVRGNDGSYWVNVAGTDGIEAVRVEGVELLNPGDRADRNTLLEAIGQSTEMSTCLPSVDFYESGGAESVASLIGEGLKGSGAVATIIYTAENHNHAAEILERAVAEGGGRAGGRSVQYLNTVIGKMSRVVRGSDEIAALGLRTITPGIERAFLVEQFNRILVSRARIGGFRPGIEVFIEKDDLLPFEEAKLYGHNAAHCLLAFVGRVKGYANMTDLKGDTAIMRVGREALLRECGGALVRKYSAVGDELFTEAGFRDYAEDLLERMTNPYLADTLARAGRDVLRKLGPEERIFGTMGLALEYGIEPANMALGAMAGIALLLEKAGEYGLPGQMRACAWQSLERSGLEEIISWLWHGERGGHFGEIVECVGRGRDDLKVLTEG
jgi:mannitol-1-phosphate 5-dehydrogenase